MLGYRNNGTVVITQPPTGYHSAIGEPGQADDEDVVRPRCRANWTR